MKILVLGGTWFLGRAVAQAALARGWSVTAFNRGRSGTAPEGTREVHGDRTVHPDLLRLGEQGPWDAVVDTSASELAPRDVLAGAQVLESAAGRYVYISTVNAYRGWPDEPLTESSELLDAPPDADVNYGRLPANWDGPDWYYGRQKAGAERAATAAFGTQRVSILRPGVILGPGEYVGRLPWWLRRTAKGGTILAPGNPDKSIQPVDVRDVAAFALDQAASSDGGEFNVTAPLGRETMGGFLTSCLDATGSNGRLTWAPDDLLVEHGVQQWTELPLWRTHAGAWNVDSTRALAAGLRCRSLAETVAATWGWMQSGGVPVEHPRWAEHGISSKKEEEILAKLRS
ncbi:NAD-dependent epimerase/dehydratase family protein [Streptomyces sp. enrichment culture]|uniref:NAD-dependent epimerase/dehydratase family protein n=1 Tax=Streptomyces sp. enrichment culture TaxID=1795815 RepID=UPI003F5586BC